MESRNTVTSTEAVREFSELLARVKHGGQSIIITRSGIPAAQLAPISSPTTFTLREFLEFWGDVRNDESDPGFAKDLERIQRADKPAKLKWDL